jgi:hypothetical protein
MAVYYSAGLERGGEGLCCQDCVRHVCPRVRVSFSYLILMWRKRPPLKVRTRRPIHLERNKKRTTVGRDRPPQVSSSSSPPEALVDQKQGREKE